MSIDKFIFLEKTQKISDFSNTDISDLNPDSKLGKLVQVANKNNYFLHSYNSDTPKVILLGYTHVGNVLNQDEEVENILRNSIEKDDIILSEGYNPFVLDLQSYKKKNHIGNLKELFEAKGNMYIYNDNKKLMADHHINKHKIPKEIFEQESIIDGENYLKLIDDYLGSFKARDDNFCYHESVGIVPIANRTAKLFKKPSEGATIFQLVGQKHIYAEFIEENLRKENISFASFVTKYEAYINFE